MLVIFDVAGLNVLKPLQVDVVEEKEGLLTDSLALVKKTDRMFSSLQECSCGDLGASETEKCEP